MDQISRLAICKDGALFGEIWFVDRCKNFSSTRCNVEFYINKLAEIDIN